MENRDIGLIIGGSIVLALTAIGLAIYGIRKMNKIVSNVIECTSGYEGVDVEEIENRVEENKEGISIVVDKNESNHRFDEVQLSKDEFIKWHDDNIDRLNKMLDGIEADQVKLKKSDEEMDKRIKKLQESHIKLKKSGEEYDKRLTEREREMKENLRLAQELVAFGKATVAELAPQAAALAQDKKMIEGKLDQLQQSENKVEISNLMLDGLEQVDEVLIRRGVLTPSDRLDYDGGKGNGVGL